MSPAAMAIGFGPTATQRLSRVGLVVAPERASRGWLRGAAVAVVLGAGVAAGYAWREGRIAPLEVPAASAGEVRALQEQSAQSALALRLSQARGRELEHQIDALNQQLGETQEQLNFFRRSREGKR